MYVFLDLEWKALPNTTEKKFDDPEQIPIPDFSAIVDRCLWKKLIPRSVGYGEYVN